ncbi:hypothetical protein MT418_002466 [Batrachochytrium dendrobatidis]
MASRVDSIQGLSRQDSIITLQINELETEYNGQSSSNSTFESNDSPTNRLDQMSHLKKLTQALYARGFLDGMFSDITVEALGHKFKLHRIVLVSNSYFAGMLSNNFWIEQSQSSISIQFDDPNITVEALTVVFSRIYGQTKMSITAENAKSLLAAGIFFDDLDICQQSMQFIISTLDESNIIEYLIFCDDFSYGTYSDSVLNTIVTQLCHRGYTEFSQLMEKLPLHWLARIVGSDCFMCPDEFSRYEFLRDVLCRRSANDTEWSKVQLRSDTACSNHTLVESNALTDLDANVPKGFSDDDSDDILCDASMDSSKSTTKDKGEACNEHSRDHLYVFANAIRFCHLSFTELKAIKKERHVQNTVLERAIWNQLELEDKIVGSSAEDLEIGSVTLADKEPIPHDDTDRIDGQFLVNVIKGPMFPYKNSTSPPFRFGIKFSNLQHLATGSKLVSKRAYYAGSYWQVYLQQISKNGLPKLGIYLQRISPNSEGWVQDESKDESESSIKPIASAVQSGRYEDKRIQVRTWFQLYCFFPNKCYTLESKPDIFKTNQSWGWRSHKLYRDAMDSGQKASFECAVVLCHV